MRKNSISKVRKEALELLEAMKNAVPVAKEDISNEVLEDAKVRLILGSYLSIFEFSLKDVYDKLRTEINPKLPVEPYDFHFRVYNQEKNFRRWIKHTLPGLEASLPDIYNIIRSIQPFVTNEEYWLKVKKIRNDGEHDDLAVQERVHIQKVNLGGSILPLGPDCIVEGNIVNGIGHSSVRTDFKGRLATPKPVNDPIVSIEDDSRFVLTETKQEVVPFLEKGLSIIDDYLKRLYNSL